MQTNIDIDLTNKVVMLDFDSTTRVHDSLGMKHAGYCLFWVTYHSGSVRNYEGWEHAAPFVEVSPLCAPWSDHVFPAKAVQRIATSEDLLALKPASLAVLPDDIELAAGTIIAAFIREGQTEGQPTGSEYSTL